MTERLNPKEEELQRNLADLAQKKEGDVEKLLKKWQSWWWNQGLWLQRDEYGEIVGIFPARIGELLPEGCELVSPKGQQKIRSGKPRSQRTSSKNIQITGEVIRRLEQLSPILQPVLRNPDRGVFGEETEGKFRAVIDANILYTGIDPRHEGYNSACRKIISLLRDRVVVWYVSGEILEEYYTVGRRLLSEPQFEVLEEIISMAINIGDVSNCGEVEPVIGDFTDNKYPQCLIACQGNLIVTHDRHLLEDPYWEGVSVNPKRFLRTVEQFEASRRLERGQV